MPYIHSSIVRLGLLDDRVQMRERLSTTNFARRVGVRAGAPSSATTSAKADIRRTVQVMSFLTSRDCGHESSVPVRRLSGLESTCDSACVSCFASGARQPRRRTGRGARADSRPRRSRARAPSRRRNPRKSRPGPITCVTMSRPSLAAELLARPRPRPRRRSRSAR